MTEDKIIYQKVAKRLSLPPNSIEAAAGLLDGGATVPFIARYRKEATGSLNEVEVRDIETTLRVVRLLEERRESVRNFIEEAGALTPEILAKLQAAENMTEIEDIYAPFKPKKRTRATVAREKGLEPLAAMIMSGRCKSVSGAASRFIGKGKAASIEEAMEGASDIIAEWAAESPRLRNITRNAYRRSASIKTTTVKGKEEDIAATPFSQYADYSQSVRRMASHQYLALRRAEREGLVKVKYTFPDSDSDNLELSLSRSFRPKEGSPDCAVIAEKAVKDASKRLLRPSVENEISASLKEEADTVAIDIFSGNLRQLLLSAPLRGKRVLAIDPGFRTGCKVVALDSQGNLLSDTVIYPVPPKADIKGSALKLLDLIHRFKLDVIALGNGTASRETEAFLKNEHIIDSSAIYVVSESGASVYSASDIARHEFPDKDVTVRGAVSIGRRLIDPLAELVKIDPKSIGVGQYQHDVDQNRLKDALDYTVMSCVNAVGVDVNTASEKLLSYVSGIGPSLAANIVAYRAENGGFKTRKELRKVPRLGDKAFELSAGFLRVPGGVEPLDNTGIHPESYGIVSKIAKELGVKTSELPANNQLLDRIDVERLAREGVGGLETIRDIVAELRKPGRDPRMDDNEDKFVPAIEDFSQIKVGMMLPGIVNNITAFGAFVDLGIKENGLIHISKVSKKRVNSVNEVLRLGQKVEARVLEIDFDRHRISLSLI